MGGFGSLPTRAGDKPFLFGEKGERMKHKNSVCLESETIEITQKDVELAKKVFVDFNAIAEEQRNFYTTVFLNAENRKLIFKFSGGICKEAKIEKIDEGEE